MKLLIIVPTKDGGEGFAGLVESLNNNILFARNKGLVFDYEALLVINGDFEKPNKFIQLDSNVSSFFNVIHLDFLGKVKAVNYVLAKHTSDFVVILDDDIVFSQDLLLSAIVELQNNESLKLVSFQVRALPYPGRNLINRFFYDVINIRSMKRLYKGLDLFLFGRFIFARSEVVKIPDNVINEDLYLSIIYDGEYMILPQEVFYYGEHSIISHTNRVLRLLAGREQLRNMYKAKYDEIHARNLRVIDKERLDSLGIYYQLCYFLYKVLRVYTNSIMVSFKRHKTSHW